MAPGSPAPAHLTAAAFLARLQDPQTDAEQRNYERYFKMGP